MSCPCVRVLALLVCLGSLSTTLAATTDAQLLSQQTPLNVIWEVLPSAADRMSTVTRAEAQLFPMQGQLYYLPAGPAAGRHTLYRLFGTSGDHMDSLSVPLAGYTTENVLGYPWSTAVRPTGTARILQGFDSANGDHALMGDALRFAGYAPAEYRDAFAYPRYGGAAPLMTVTGNQITVASNLAAGGAVQELWWNGAEFLDHGDYGRGMQSSISFSGTGASSALPTEAGDGLTAPDRNYMHGAPVLSEATTYGGARKVQSTRAAPLEWNYMQFNGGAIDTPVAYAGWQLGKDLVLDDSALNLGPGFAALAPQVVRYNTQFLNGGVPLTEADIEIPTAYLRPQFARGFTFDATLTDINAAAHEVANGEFVQIAAGVFHYQYNATAGGVIYANAGLDHALGLYGTLPAVGGSAAYFTLWKFGTLAAPSVTKWSAGAGPLTLVTGWNTFHAWVVAGTYDQVRTAMHQLYVQGYR